ncbi:GNAT family N-acetyltransferase [Bradyrhizobium australafricanum]|uniref:GNAT family N-acetyltransferase n=1 Tax=Bradyrhizobium australafricanum TaxID=2821406 RepID=UPI001CE28805|nr:GNAT family N-acetyltransferase [Bradyrhizobium australafricanum]MCA6104883.1 GNAT family N-acetyltransferase [Bradyrhizobium australafricanum]
MELSFCPLDLESTHVAVAEEDRRIVGVVQVKVTADDAELLKLFVEPEVLRKGTGKALFAWATDLARRMGAHRMVIEADPDAAPFYRGIGARDAGTAPSGSLPGRMLPRLTFDVLQAGPALEIGDGFDVSLWPEAAVRGCLLFRHCRGISRHPASRPK